MEIDSIDGIAVAVVAAGGRAVLHAVVPVPDVLEPVHLQDRCSALVLDTKGQMKLAAEHHLQQTGRELQRRMLNSRLTHMLA